MANTVKRAHYLNMVPSCVLDAAFRRTVGSHAFSVWMTLFRRIWRGNQQNTSLKKVLGSGWDAGLLVCSWGEQQIAEELGLSHSTVKRAIRILKKVGAIYADRKNHRSQNLTVLGCHYGEMKGVQGSHRERSFVEMGDCEDYLADVAADIAPTLLQVQQTVSQWFQSCKSHVSNCNIDGSRVTPVIQLHGSRVTPQMRRHGSRVVQ